MPEGLHAMPHRADPGIEYAIPRPDITPLTGPEQIPELP
jgi:hypothetical protein